MSTDIRPEMPIISLWMPWANWVSLGWKKIETRTHQRFKGLVGRRIGVHASQKWDDKAIDAARPYLTEWQVRQSREFLKIGGAIICTATVASHRPLDRCDENAALIECESVPRWGLTLQDVEMIEAIPCNGKQGIWYLKGLTQ